MPNEVRNTQALEHRAWQLGEVRDTQVLEHRVHLPPANLHICYVVPDVTGGAFAAIF
jgi:hypothetical protein